MKNIFLFSILFVLFFFNSGIAQTIDTDCTDVTVTGGIPNYQSNLYSGPWRQLNKCDATVIFSATTMKHQMFLQKLNHQTGLFETISGPPQYPPNNTFSNPGHGTYRVKVIIPVPLTSNSCINGFVNVFSTSGTLIGFRGTLTGESFSNEVIVGKTTSADISYTFIDIPETGPESAYDFGEDAKMDVSASKNYNLYWVSISEQSGMQRYRSNGWTNGTIEEFNLTNLWRSSPHFTWKFETGNAYTVQFAIENDKCINSSWNNLARTFFICPAGFGCRFGIDEREIVISPNPAGSFIRLQNFEPELDRNYRITIMDLTGRVVITTPLLRDEVDISDLPNGMFAVTVWKEGRQIFNSKLVVNH